MYCAEDSIDITVTSAGGPVTYDCDVQPVLDRSCIGCHGSSGGVNLQGCEQTRDSGVVDPGSKETSSLYTEIDSGDMPKGAPRLPQSERDAIGDWIDALDPFDPDFCD